LSLRSFLRPNGHSGIMATVCTFLRLRYSSSAEQFVPICLQVRRYDEASKSCSGVYLSLVARLLDASETWGLANCCSGCWKGRAEPPRARDSDVALLEAVYCTGCWKARATLVERCQVLRCWSEEKEEEEEDQSKRLLRARLHESR